MKKTRAAKRSAASASVQNESMVRTIWLRRPPAARTEQPLTPSRIVKEAVALLDGEGIEGLTMRRLAERLGKGSTTLYWHVSTKNELLELALDEVFGEIPLPGKRSARWQDDIKFLMMGWRAAILRHPWSTALPGRPLLGPNILVRMEFLQATLVRAGFGKEHLGAVTWCLCNYVMGAATAQVNWHMRNEERALAQAFLAAQRRSYPTLAAQDYMLYTDRDGSFKQALDYLLEGIERYRTRG